jgi:hypothetical protein
MPITCFIKGGLGNQLFQIYTTAAYALSHKQSFVFPYQSKMQGGWTPRSAYWDTFLAPLRRFTTTDFDDLYNMPVIQCPQHHYVEIPAPHPTQSCRIDGYFQSHKYFAGTDGERLLTRMMRIADRIRDIKSLYDLPWTYNVSMHFRLGDYKQLSQYHTVLEDDYYTAALEQVLLRSANVSGKPVKVYYVCEDSDLGEILPRIAELQRQFNGRAEFVPLPPGLTTDWEQMLFMSACDANIIANSSFSWWGAYWNPAPNKVVCYPRRWFGPALANHDVRDMFPEDWVLV